MRKSEIDTKLNPDNLEMASQTKIWRSWYATTTAPLKDIKKGFLDDCREHGFREPDRIELIAADGLCTLLVKEITTYGVGFSMLASPKPVASFEPERKFKKAPKPPKQPLAPKDEGPPKEEFDLTDEERSNGWTVKTKAEYMRRNLGVEPVYVGE